MPLVRIAPVDGSALPAGPDDPGGLGWTWRQALAIGGEHRGDARALEDGTGLSFPTGAPSQSHAHGSSRQRPGPRRKAGRRPARRNSRGQHPQQAQALGGEPEREQEKQNPEAHHHGAVSAAPEPSSRAARDHATSIFAPTRQA